MYLLTSQHFLLYIDQFCARIKGLSLSIPAVNKLNANKTSKKGVKIERKKKIEKIKSNA